MKKIFMVLVAAFFVSIGIGLNASFADSTTENISTNPSEDYVSYTMLSEESTSYDNVNDGYLSESIANKSDSVINPSSSDSNSARESIRSIATSRPKKIQKRSVATLENDITPSDFNSLKQKIESPDREETVIVPGGKYVFVDTINVVKDLVLKNKTGEKVVFQLGMYNQNPDSLGKTMMDIKSGKVTLDADSDENFIFSGSETPLAFNVKVNEPHNGAYIKGDTKVTRNGVFTTVREGSSIVINHGIFTNAAGSGPHSGPILVDPKGKLVMNGGKIIHNYQSHGETTANASIWKDMYEAQAVSAGITSYGGDVTINGGEISDNYHSYGSGGAITSVGALVNGREVVRSKVIINGGTIENNAVWDFDNREPGNFIAHRGGAVFQTLNSDLIVNGGDFIDNFGIGGGGAIFSAWCTTVTVNGGLFKGNTTESGGGAIATHDSFTNIQESEDESIYGELNPYGIKDIDSWYAKGFGVDFVVNGGTFEENKAYMGGAIYVASQNAEINAGIFKNNEANRFGGAVYLSTNPYVLYIKNALIEKNEADDKYGSMGNNYFPKLEFQTGSGGGLWYCPTGSGEINVSNGVAIFDNISSHEGGDFSSLKKIDDYSVSIVNRMLGGGYISWYNDSISKRYTKGDKELDVIDKYKDNLALLSGTEDFSKNAARILATTVFTNNKAKRGGAVATNGKVIFGSENLEFSIKVIKDWSEKIEESDRKPVKIALVVVRNENEQEKEYIVDEAELNKENGYTHTFEKLPLEANGRLQYRVKELGEDYVASYSYTLKRKLENNDSSANPNKFEGNTFATRDLLNGDEILISVKNDPKPVKPNDPGIYVPENPNNPDPDEEKPQNPDKENPKPDKDKDEEKPNKDTEKEKPSKVNTNKSDEKNIPNKVKYSKGDLPNKLPRTGDFGIGGYALFLIYSAIAFIAFRKRV